ncbi:hypothetical protein [Pseudoxanthomonas suwonensis]|uniref:hypothetical protein n=1 Tax=Pseudoxanthomonas suwonensis TaxID=314722 RepID=UPI001185D5EE|nr:hypothetical protein [Pseudoxanthomonas suwonensis]
MSPGFGSTACALANGPSPVRRARAWLLLVGLLLAGLATPALAAGSTLQGWEQGGAVAGEQAAAATPESRSQRQRSPVAATAQVPLRRPDADQGSTALAVGDSAVPQHPHGPALKPLRTGWGSRAPPGPRHS